MSQDRMVGLLGGILMVVGVFLPILSLPMGEVTYFRNGEGDGVFFLLLGLLAIGLLFFGFFKLVYAVAGLALALLAIDFFGGITRINQMKAKVSSDLEGNPFRGFADMALESVQLQWGWAVMFIGVLMVFWAPRLRPNSESPAP